MNFNNRRYITAGVNTSLDPGLICFLWDCIDLMPGPKDYLQVFCLSVKDGRQHIAHTSESPPFSTEYLLTTDTPFFCGKIYAIDDGTHSTILLSQKY